MSETEVTTAMLSGLVAKIESLDLTDAERAMIDRLLTRAAATEISEVEGFITSNMDIWTFKGTDEELPATSRRWAVALGCVKNGQPMGFETGR